MVKVKPNGVTVVDQAEIFNLRVCKFQKHLENAVFTH